MCVNLDFLDKEGVAIVRSRQSTSVGVSVYLWGQTTPTPSTSVTFQGVAVHLKAMVGELEKCAEI